MMLAAVYVAVCVLVGFATGRWWVVAAAPAVWPVFFVGLRLGWWGNGVGDGWQAMLAFMTVVTALATALGVALRRATWATSPRHLSGDEALELATREQHKLRRGR